MYMRSSFVGGRAGIRLLHQVSSEEQRGPAMQDASSWALSFPQEGHEGDWHDNYQQMLGDMPPTVMVHSSGREDVFA